MNAIMSTAARRTALSTLAALALAAALPAAVFAKSAPKADIWTVNIAKSKFGVSFTTLVLEHPEAAPRLDANGYPAANTFLVVSNGKLYLAIDEAASASGNGAENVAYSRWAGMKLSQVADQVRSSDVCGMRCKFGMPDSRPMTLTFKTKGGTAEGLRLASVLVFGRR